jgi:hypothetical protein
MFTPIYEIKVIDKNIVSLTFENFRDQSISLFRLSEFYESPYEEIRNQRTGIDDFLYFYMTQKGKINYFSYWDAFNIPGYSIVSFIDHFRFDLTRTEKTLFSEIIDLVDENEPFYLISALKGRKSDFEHEFCHAKYFLDEKYRTKVQEIIDSIPKKLYNKFKDNLVKCGYSNDEQIIVDEINAYLSTSSRKYIRNNFVYDDDIEKYQKKLKKLFKKMKS